MGCDWTVEQSGTPSPFTSVATFFPFPERSLRAVFSSVPKRRSAVSCGVSSGSWFVAPTRIDDGKKQWFDGSRDVYPGSCAEQRHSLTGASYRLFCTPLSVNSAMYWLSPILRSSTVRSIHRPPPPALHVMPKYSECAVCTSGYGRGVATECHRCTPGFKAGMYFAIVIASFCSLVVMTLLVVYLVSKW